MLVGRCWRAAAMGAMSLLVGRAVKPLDVAGRDARAPAERRLFRARRRRRPAGNPQSQREGQQSRGGARRLESRQRRIDGAGLRRSRPGTTRDCARTPRRTRPASLRLARKRGASGQETRRAIRPPRRRRARSKRRSEALQAQNRRILADLRPAALEELGLAEALEALVAHWRRAEPADRRHASTSTRARTALGERASQMAYRFVQEAMTNAFRHSGATRIDVSLGFEAPAETRALRDPALAGLVIRVADDGRGLQGESAAGNGARRDARSGAHAGRRVRVVSAAEGGVAVEARFATRADRRSGKFPGIFGNTAGKFRIN